MSDSVTRNEPEFGSVLQKDVSGGLLRIDADPVLRDDGRRGRRDFELFGRELEDGRERSVLRNAQDLERQLRIGGQDDLESHLRTCAGHRLNDNSTRFSD